VREAGDDRDFHFPGASQHLCDAFDRVRCWSRDFDAPLTLVSPGPRKLIFAIATRAFFDLTAIGKGLAMATSDAGVHIQ
jgi:hypothetical protein